MTPKQRAKVEPVSTPVGEGRLFIDRADEQMATVVLGHGAGGGVDAKDLTALAGQLPQYGITVVRFEQPWRTAGRKVAVLPPKLDQGWIAAVEHLRGTVIGEGERLYFGGRSAGARVACRTAPLFPVTGVICLAFPLHPPGRPDKSRAPELLGAGVPRLVLQGSKDAFGGPAEVRAAIAEAAGPGGAEAEDENPDDAGVDVVEIPGADHSFRVAKTAVFSAGDVTTLVVDRVSGFCLPGCPPLE